MKNVLVLGGGKVGSAIAYDLAKQYIITVADIDQNALQKTHARNNNIKIQYQDFSELHFSLHSIGASPNCISINNFFHILSSIIFPSVFFVSI